LEGLVAVTAHEGSMLRVDIEYFLEEVLVSGTIILISNLGVGLIHGVY
jgi:hypothetical protein